MPKNLIQSCFLWSAVALLYDAGLRMYAATADQPVPGYLNLGLAALYAVIGFATVKRFGFTGALTASAAAGAVVGTVGLSIGIALRVVPEVMPLSPVAEVATAVISGSLGAVLRVIFSKP